MKLLKLFFLVGVIILAIEPPSTHAQVSCDQDWFGSRCQYKCHCNTGATCDSDGICSDGKCEREWFGPACQYVNWMTKNSTTAPTWLIDDDDSTCNPDASDQSINVTSSTPFPFTWFRLSVKDQDLLRDITVTFNDNKNCTNMRSAMVTSTTLDTYCDLDVLVDKVTLSGEGVSSLCSLYISGGRNVALKQKVSQATTKGSSVAENAVDGSTDHDIASCSLTKDQGDLDDAKWTLEFSQYQWVNRYILYNRLNYVRDDGLGCCKLQLQGFVLESFDQSGRTIFTYRDETHVLEDVYTVIAYPLVPFSPIYSVNISATRFVFGGVTLPLCEVEMYGDTACKGTTFGRDCEYTCNCETAGLVCFVSTGGCSTGCAPGYQGENCLQDCSATTYGLNCALTCSSECEDGVCDSVTGYCGGCPAGKMGDLCDQDCPSTKHDKGCLEDCSTNCLDRECNGITGICIDCPAGKIGTLCEKDCEPGKYGKNCRESCSEFCNVNGTRPDDSPCNITTGNCFRGCRRGYVEPRCLTLSDGDSPSDSGLVIGLSVGIGLLVLVIIAGAVLGVYCYRRRPRARSSQQGDQPGYSGIDMKNQDDHGYQVMYKSADDYNLPKSERKIEDDDATTGSLDQESRHAALYENGDVGHYEEIGDVALREDGDEQEPCGVRRSKHGVENSGYVNC